MGNTSMSVGFSFTNWYKTPSWSMAEENQLEKGEATSVVLEQRGTGFGITVKREGQKDRMYDISAGRDSMQVGFGAGSASMVDDEPGTVNLAEKEALFWVGQLRNAIYSELNKTENDLALASDSPKLLVWSGGTEENAKAAQEAAIAAAKARKPELEAKVAELQDKAQKAEQLMARLVTASFL